jgi:hypothetical protein
MRSDVSKARKPHQRWCSFLFFLHFGHRFVWAWEHSDSMMRREDEFLARLLGRPHKFVSSGNGSPGLKIETGGIQNRDKDSSRLQPPARVMAV